MRKNAVTRKLFSWDEETQDKFSEKVDKMMSDEVTEDMLDRVAMERVPEEDKILLTDLETGDQAVAEVTEDEVMFSELVSPENAPEPGKDSSEIENVSRDVQVGDKVYFKVLDKVCFGEVLKVESSNNVTVKVDPSCGVDLNVVALHPQKVFLEESKAMSSKKTPKGRRTFNEDIQQLNSSATNDPDMTDVVATTESIDKVAPSMDPTAPAPGSLNNKSEVITEVPEVVASTAPDAPVAPVVSAPGTSIEEQPMSENVSILDEEEMKTFDDSMEEGSEEDDLDLMDLGDELPAPSVDPMAADQEVSNDNVRTFSAGRRTAKHPVDGLFRKF